MIPAGPTHLEPTQTSGFSALNIPTRIKRGQIEIMYPVLIAQKGEKVDISQSCMLRKLQIKPYTYWFEIEWIWMDAVLYIGNHLNQNRSQIESDIFHRFTMD